MADDKEKRPQRQGIANPGPLRDALEAIDTAIVEIAALRNETAESVEDAFSSLRSSAQLFREIFWGVELPVKSADELLKRAGGPLRLITASYRETGPIVLALGDIVEAIPDFEKVFPITNFQKLADTLEEIREAEEEDSGTFWFVTRVKKKFLTQALKARGKAIDLSVLSRTRAPLSSCTQCGAKHSPAAVVTGAFADLQIAVGAERWTGKRVGQE
ncbi:MAG TPA: hypothetical protein VHX14_16375 [Thermoanaerobaculia bacterium]|jgi:hypothetical protein|nr:hypothetical protein [Thermoanaerobaculia bacterium]